MLKYPFTIPKYPKIPTIYERDPETKFKTLIEGRWATEEIAYLADREWAFTEKIDGTNIRIHWDGEKAEFGGRTDNAQIPAFLAKKLQELFLDNEIWSEFESATLYGEGYGARIQKGGGNYIPDGVSFILFDVLIGDIWLKREDVEDIANKFEIDVVPICGRGPLHMAIDIARNGFKSNIGTATAEGLVMRPAVELFDRRGKRIITKVKTKDFVKA